MSGRGSRPLILRFWRLDSRNGPREQAFRIGPGASLGIQACVVIELGHMGGSPACVA